MISDTLKKSFGYFFHGTLYNTWKRDNPGENNLLLNYWQNGGTPPTFDVVGGIRTDTGKGFVTQAQAYWDFIALITPSAAFGWGFSAHTLQLGGGADAYVANLSGAGAQILRDDLTVTFKTGPSQWGALASLAKKYGCRVVAIMANSDDSTSTPAQVANHAKALATYFNSNFPGVLLAVEPMNEPNIGAYRSNPEGYAALCRAVKDALVGLPVETWASTSGVGQTVWNGKLDWTERVLIADPKCFDAWACHPYYFFTGSSADNMLTMNVPTGWNKAFWYRDSATGGTLADMLASHGYTGPIHATEVGPPTDAYPSGIRVVTKPDGSKEDFGTTSEAEAAAWFPRAYSMWRAEPRAGWFCIYTGYDKNSASTNNREDHFGAFHTDGTPKKIVAEMKKIAKI